MMRFLVSTFILFFLMLLNQHSCKVKAFAVPDLWSLSPEAVLAYGSVGGTFLGLFIKNELRESFDKIEAKLDKNVIDNNETAQEMLSVWGKTFQGFNEMFQGYNETIQRFEKEIYQTILNMTTGSNNELKQVMKDQAEIIVERVNGNFQELDLKYQIVRTSSNESKVELEEMNKKVDGINIKVYETNDKILETKSDIVETKSRVLDINEIVVDTKEEQTKFINGIYSRLEKDVAALRHNITRNENSIKEIQGTISKLKDKQHEQDGKISTLNSTNHKTHARLAFVEKDVAFIRGKMNMDKRSETLSKVQEQSKEIDTATIENNGDDV